MLLRFHWLALGIAAVLAAALSPAYTTSLEPDDRFCAMSVNQPQAPVCAETREDLAAAWSGSDPARANTVLLAILYDNANMDSSAGILSIYGPASCTSTTSDIDYSVGNLGSFNQRTSSFQSYNNCATRLWSGTSFAGTAFPSNTGFLVSSTYVGAAFNDKAQSAQFS